MCPLCAANAALMAAAALSTGGFTAMAARKLFRPKKRRRDMAPKPIPGESIVTKTQTEQARVVSPAEWLAARKDLLAREKNFTRERDALSAERRKMPWVRVEKPYVFEGPGGKQALADLFGGRRQLNPLARAS